MSKIAIICPTRSRPSSSIEVYNSWHQTTSGNSDLWFILDNDDEMNYPRIANANYLVVPRGRRGIADPGNAGAIHLAKKYKYIMFIGDDNRFRTPKWDSIFISKMKLQGNYGYVYSNDLLQGANLPTVVMISSNIVNTLGYAMYPEFQHLWIDNYWLALGKAIGKITYLEDVIIEHMHYSNGKSKHDNAYKEVNNDNVAVHDYNVFTKWLSDGLQREKELIINIDKIKML